ncbi:hypothetical protein F2Q69_00015612 [Brassica cretica]|uniref:RNase H type-1 domain-containing protein n=1 Tax=Brassica cretica TaxID=69181 RepID=A0A8S9R185_BRACR|nr:hypothetical protein F2Q69_00015612 [Brassica cretica]
MLTGGGGGPVDRIRKWIPRGFRRSAQIRSEGSLVGRVGDQAVRSRKTFLESRVFIKLIKKYDVTVKAQPKSEANRCADAIARSVTRDHHYASYIEKGGPSWLLPMIRAEAGGAVNGY